MSRLNASWLLLHLYWPKFSEVTLRLPPFTPNLPLHIILNSQKTQFSISVLQTLLYILQIRCDLSQSQRASLALAIHVVAVVATIIGIKVFAA